MHTTFYVLPIITGFFYMSVCGLELALPHLSHHSSVAFLSGGMVG